MRPDAAFAIRQRHALPTPAIYAANLPRLDLVGGRAVAVICHAYSDVAMTSDLVAGTPDDRVFDALPDLAEHFLRTRVLVRAAHQVLMAEIQASGGLRRLHISDQAVDVIVAAVKAEAQADAVSTPTPPVT